MLFKSQKASTRTASDRITISLSQIEVFNLEYGLAPTTTVDWFKGDYRAAVAFLKSQMDRILMQNPWLSGRYLGKDRFEYSESERLFDVQDMLVVVEPSSSPIEETAAMPTYEEMIQLGQRKDLGLTLVANNFEKQPFWKVAVIPRKDESSFCLYVSLTHGIGDGYTFYSLYNMLLGAGSPIRAMTPERIATSQAQQEAAMGCMEANNCHSLGLVTAVVAGMVKAHLSLNKEKTRRLHRIFLVDPAKIAQIKAQYKETRQEGDEPYITTNDIITSWLLSRSNCRHGLMALNLRGRLEGHTQDHAFNAENDLYFRCPEDTVRPELVRHAAKSLKRAVTADQPLKPWSLAPWRKKTTGVCLSTNWAGFQSGEIYLAGAKHLVHLPAYDMKETLTPDMAVGITFTPRKGQMAVLLGGTSEKLAGLARAPFEADAPLEMF